MGSNHVTYVACLHRIAVAAETWASYCLQLVTRPSVSSCTWTCSDWKCDLRGWPTPMVCCPSYLNVIRTNYCRFCPLHSHDSLGWPREHLHLVSSFHPIARIGHFEILVDCFAFQPSSAVASHGCSIVLRLERVVAPAGRRMANRPRNQSCLRSRHHHRISLLSYFCALYIF